MYDPAFIQPMRDEVTRLGAKEVLTPASVDEAVKAPGTTLVFINSMCGCAAGGARPGLAVSLTNKNVPDRVVTAFAGNDVEAVKHARSLFLGYAPSSPQFGMFKDGELVFMLERWQIEGRHPLDIAKTLAAAYNEYCAKTESVTA